ncbi:MAG: diguanylate cyclase [Alkalispirochaeta sp.]
MIDPDLLVQTIENADQGIYLARLDGTLVYANRRFAEITGIDAGEVTGRSLDRLPFQTEPAAAYPDLFEMIRKGERVQRSVSINGGPARSSSALEIIAPIYRGTTVTACIGTIAVDTPCSDVSEVMTEPDTALFLLDGLPDGVRYRSVTAAYAALADRKVEEIVGRHPREVWRGGGPSRLLEYVERCVTRDEPVTFEETFRSNKRERVLETTLRPVVRPMREVLVIGSSRDRSEQRRLQEELRFLTEHDALTNEPNRATISDELERELSRSVRHRRPLAVLLVDVDRFKSINDEFGHEVGDAALRGIVSTFHAALRPSDRLGRWGGDEFLIILPETTRDGALTAAERIRTAVETAAIVTGHVLTVSIGIGAVAPIDPSRTAGLTHSTDSLIRVADEEVQRAKTDGRNRVSG